MFYIMQYHENKGPLIKLSNQDKIYDSSLNLLLVSMASHLQSLWKKPLYINQLNTMIATSKHVLFPGHNHLLTTDTDGPPL